MSLVGTNADSQQLTDSNGEPWFLDGDKGHWRILIFHRHLG